jgi:UDP-N-acetylmuramoylalanine--D-glutamate ligase
VLGELELAWRLLQNEFVAVTGTNGKTTTTEWIGHIYREAALPVAVAGNVGTAVS